MGEFRAFWTEDTLWSLLTRQARERPDAIAILYDGAEVTYAALAGRAEQVAYALAAMGVRSGDVVSVQLPNCIEFLVTYLGLSRLGAILSTIHMPYRLRETAELMRAARSKVFIGLACRQGYQPAKEVMTARPSLPNLGHVVAVGEELPEGALRWNDLAGAPALDVKQEPPSAGAAFLLLFTSGTSSNPKGVRVDYRRFMANARLNRAEMGIDASSVMLSAAPYTHLLGLLTFHMALYAGGATLLLPEFTPAGFVNSLRAARPTHVFVAPAHLAACQAQGLLDCDALASVRYLVASGATAPASLYRTIKQLMPNGSLAQVWGMTELQCGIFHRPGEDIERVATSCGRPAPGFEARIADARGRTLPPDTEGELQVRGVSVFDGYFENAGATAEAFTTDGWFRTGDTARMDRAGYVTITGRIKDIINRGGVKINPIDVEQAIARMPGVAQCAIAPVPDPIMGERACAYIVPEAGATISLAAVTDWLAAQQIAKIKWPERVEVIAEMPLTPTRKVIKGRLRPSATT